MRPRIFIWGRPEQYERYRLALAEAGGETDLSEDVSDAETCDALLLPGGGDVDPALYGQENRAAWNLEMERDRAEAQLLARFCAAGRPVLGICRGMQMINVFFGGTLIQDLEGHRQAGGIDRLHRVFTAPSALRGLWGPRVIVNSAHHQAVDRLGVGLRAVQTAPDGTVEAIEHETLPLWAVQWHPERLRGPLAKAGAADGQRLFYFFLSQIR